MRLIDADALKEKAFGKRGGLIHTADIDAMPTIEPMRKKGWWYFEEYPDGYYHSECDQCGRWFGEEAYMDHWNFCPNCGARMDGGEQE